MIRPGPPVVTAQPAAAGDSVCLTEDILTTESAAHRVAVDPEQFRKWAKRRQLRPVTYVRVGRSTKAVWSLEQVLEADRRGPTARTATN